MVFFLTHSRNRYHNWKLGSLFVPISQHGEKPQIPAQETLTDWIENSDPSFLENILDARNKPLDKVLSFAYLN